MTWNRRDFIRTASGSFGVAVAGPGSAAPGTVEAAGWNPAGPLLDVSRPLTVQPVFMYRLTERKERTSWKSWGGIQTQDAVNQEITRINRELQELPKPPGVKVLPVVPVTSPEQAAKVHEGAHDAVLIYACTGPGTLLRACFSPQKDTLIFVRHRSGPVYYWYEALSTRYLGGESSVHQDDVVVDDLGELAAKLRGLAGARNLQGTRIVALGGAAGKYSAEAPEVARTRYRMEIIEVGYEEFGKRIQAARADKQLAAAAVECARRYLKLPGTTLRTELPFVTNSFVLYVLFKELMAEHKASAFTVKGCMSTIIPMSETTACLTLQILNDEGYIAFCESDFVVIPPGVLLRHVSGLPVFMHNSTFPHQRMVTCAHCTGPRRMNGRDYNPAIITTHYESEYGAAPKVEITPGQEVTFISPEYSTGRWVGFKGIVRANPFYEICRSQQDVEIQGKWELLKNEVRDSHWMMVYGDCLNEAAYAARKLGVRWADLS